MGFEESGSNASLLSAYDSVPGPSKDSGLTVLCL